MLDALELAATRGEDLLKNGFWASSLQTERPLSGMTAAILRQAQDVTVQVLQDNPSPQQIRDRCAALERQVMQQATQKAEVKSFDEGTAYVLFQYDIYTDIRLVGIPPESVARLGGQAAYGTWPHYAADFAFLRIYTDADNKPAPYHRDNHPYTPAYSFPISQAGVQQGLPLAAIGYPGETSLYLPSASLASLLDHVLPQRIRLATATQQSLAAQIDRSYNVARDYGSVFRALSASSKTLQDLRAQMDAQRLLPQRATIEQDWINQAAPQQQAYLTQLLQDIQTTERTYTTQQVQSMSLRMAIEWVGLFRLAHHMQALTAPHIGPNSERLWHYNAKLSRSVLKRHFHRYHPSTDTEICAALLQAICTSLPDSALPKPLLRAKYRNHGDFSAYAQALYKHSALALHNTAFQLLDGLTPGHTKTLQRDPAYRVMDAIATWHDQTIAPQLEQLGQHLHTLRRQYLDLYKQQHPHRIHYPDANSTLRISFGHVAPTHQGTPALAPATDIPAYTASTGATLPRSLALTLQDPALTPVSACFLAAMHTTNGNSGSPILNPQGQLVGIDMARTRSGWTSDYDYDPRHARAVIADIRYILLVTQTLSHSTHITAQLLYINSL